MIVLREMAASDIPSSVLGDITRKVVMRGSVAYVPLFCANCGADGGWVPEEGLHAIGTFAFYLCDPCADKHGQIPEHTMIPIEKVWQKIAEAQLEHDGRYLTAIEIDAALRDPNHYLSILARDVPR